MLRKSLFLIFGFLLRIFFRVEVEGLDYVPLSGPAIVTVNHPGRLEVISLFAVIPRQDATGWIAEKYRNWPGMVWLAKAVNAIWIDRFRADVEALRAAQEYLEAGGMMGIAPEGTRSPTHSLMEGKQGVAYLAAKTGAPVIPAGVTYAENAVKQAFFLRRPRVIIRFSEPFTLPPLTSKGRHVALAQATDEIMCRIAALIPPEMRGVYADHPRLREILA
jgi:1-acyl-sn-glycerol-3-phosphate acyltransferase